MSQEFILTPKQDKSVTMTVRIPAEINEQLEELARQSGRSRNEIINLALQYAFEHLRFEKE